MFIQFIEGRVTDPETLHQQIRRWIDELAPDAPGWLGSTGGITADGTGFLAARFASEEDARRNSDRPEQGAWWKQTEGCFDGTPDFVDCDDVRLLRDGGRDDAGFVQVIRGRVTDTEKALALLDDFDEGMGDARPDVLGGYVGVQPDGSFTQVVYFSSEEDAREGERRSDEDRPGEQAAFEALMAAPPRYLDLTEPWLHGA